MELLVHMQVKAIIRAACAAESAGALVKPGIMLPLLSSATEYRSQVQLIHEVAQETLEDAESLLKYEVGAIIDRPSAVLLAGEVAGITDFFCFGTDHLIEYAFTAGWFMLCAH